MAKRLDTSSVSEEDVTALFEDHDLFGANGEKSGGTETQDDEDEPSTGDENEEEPEQEEAQGEDEPEADDQEEPEEEEATEESDEDDEGQEPEANALDWKKVDKRYAAEHQKAQAEVQKWQKAHSKLQSQLTRESKARQQEDTTLTTLRAKATAADQWDALLAKHPDLQVVLEREIAKIRDPFKDVPEYLKQDPLFQQMQHQNQRLEERLSQFEKSFEPIKDIQNERVETKNRQRLDGLLTDAAAQYKEMFSKDITKAEARQVLEYMVKNRAYTDGKFAAWKVFSGQAQQVNEAQRAERLKAKAKKFGARNRTLNTGRPGKKENANTAEEAIAMALAEQGYGT